MDMTLELKAAQELIERRLEGYFAEALPQKSLTEAMRYSLLAGGKRIRPVIALKFCSACNGDVEAVLPAACAVEMVHTYSLIHDDLPCMDDDDLRRGKPTNHKVYGECMATLAGDALQAEAFSALLKSTLQAERVVKMAQALSEAAGIYGICGGQTLDMEAEGKVLSEAEIRRIHNMKTAAMLIAPAKIGVISAGGSAEQLDAAERYARSIGLAFQIRDDILDITATTEELGKPVGSDKKNEKQTFAVIFGVDRCKKIIAEETEKAVAAIEGVFDRGEFLIWLARNLAERKC